jgi:hypothetical protein
MARLPLKTLPTTELNTAQNERASAEYCAVGVKAREQKEFPSETGEFKPLRYFGASPASDDDLPRCPVNGDIFFLSAFEILKCGSKPEGFA